MEELRRIIESLTHEELLKVIELADQKLWEKPKFPDIKLSGKPPVRLEIPYKFPSLNEYTQACRTNAYAGASMKKKVQRDIGLIINTLPVFTKPVVIDFLWHEGSGRRDPDNVAFAKKFILDALVECGKLKDDNRKVVTAFRDKIYWTNDKEWKVILEISEVDDEET